MSEGERVVESLIVPITSTPSIFASTTPPIPLIDLFKRYSSAKAIRFYHQLWKTVVQRWVDVCRETFYKLPPPPEIISASRYAKEIGVSHVTAKKRLLKNPDFLRLSNKFFVSMKTTYLPFILKSPSPQGFVSAVQKLRRFPSDLEPTPKNIKMFLGNRGYYNLEPTGLIGKIRLMFGRNKHFVFVSEFALRKLNGGKRE